MQYSPISHQIDTQADYQNDQQDDAQDDAQNDQICRSLLSPLSGILLYRWKAALKTKRHVEHRMERTRMFNQNLYEKAIREHHKDLQREMEQLRLLAHLQRPRQRWRRPIAQRVGIFFRELGMKLKQLAQPM